MDSVDFREKREIDREDVEEALSMQDRIRAKTGGWNGEEEIRKWRRKR